MKTNSCLLRLSDEENDLLTFKANLLGLSKSKLLRTGALSYWSDNFNAKGLLKLYQEGNDKTGNALQLLKLTLT